MILYTRFCGHYTYVLFFFLVLIFSCKVDMENFPIISKKKRKILSNYIQITIP